MKPTQRSWPPESPRAWRLAAITCGIDDADPLATPEEMEDALEELARRTPAVNHPIDRT